MSSIPLACGESGPPGERPASSPAKATCARASPSRATIKRAPALLRTRDGILWSVPERTRVQLPAGVGPHFQVFLNGVPQQAGVDYRREGTALVFPGSLAEEGRLGFWRWFSLFLGVAGTYRQNDSVDVVYDVNGRKIVRTGLPILDEEPMGEPGRRE